MTYKDDILGTRLWYEVSGLKPATEYVFRVAARNLIGQGQFSAIVGATTLETGSYQLPTLKSHLTCFVLLSVFLEVQFEKHQIMRENGENSKHLWFGQNY